GTVGSAVAFPLPALGDLLGDIDEVVVLWSGHGHLWSARAAPAAHCSSIGGCIRCALSSLASLPPAREEPEAAAGNLYLLPIRTISVCLLRAERSGTTPATVPAGEDTNEPALTHCPVGSTRRRAADLAVQCRLGLLSERRSRPHPTDPHRAGADTYRAIAP